MAPATGFHEHTRPKTHQYVYVIGNVADHFWNPISGADDTAYVSVKAIAPIRINYWDTVLGAENDMVMEGKMSGGHGGLSKWSNAPAGTDYIHTPVPVANATG